MRIQVASSCIVYMRIFSNKEKYFNFQDHRLIALSYYHTKSQKQNDKTGDAVNENFRRYMWHCQVICFYFLINLFVFISLNFFYTYTKRMMLKKSKKGVKTATEKLILKSDSYVDNSTLCAFKCVGILI